MANLTLIIFIRRTSKLFFLLLLFASPFVQLARTYWQEPYPYTFSPFVKNDFFRKNLAAVVAWIFENLETFFTKVSGGPYSVRFFDLHVVEPATALINLAHSAFSSSYWNPVMMVSFSFSIVLAVLVGRIYCGYICPFSSIANLNLRLQKRFFKRTPKYSATLSKSPNWPTVLFHFLLLVVVISSPEWIQFLLPPAALQHFVSDYILYGSLTLWGVGILFFVALELSYPALFCRKLCPTGLVLSYLGILRGLTLRHKPETTCEPHCTKCNQKCWLGLNPKRVALDSACDLCHRCVTVCPTGRLHQVGRRPSLQSIRLSRKNSGFATSLLFMIILFTSQQTDANIWTNDPSYFFDMGYEINLTEDRIEFISDGQTFEIFYSYACNYTTETPDRINLYIHVRRKDRLDNKIFENSLQISTEKGERIANQEVPNFPISILRRSVYLFKDISYSSVGNGLLLLGIGSSEIMLPLKIHSSRF